MIYCPNCETKFEGREDMEVCPACGSEDIEHIPHHNFVEDIEEV